MSKNPAAVALGKDTAMTNRTRRWLVLTNVDPFPVFIAHANLQDVNPSTGQPRYMDGPFYSAGGKTYHFDEPRTRAWAEGVVKYWEPRGYRFTLTEEWR